MKKALVCVMNSLERKKSYIQKLYGDPDLYAHKFADHSFADKLPIHQSWIHYRGYDFLHSISIDYDAQKVYCANNFDGRLEYGYFIYENNTYSYFFDFVPDTKQVTITNTSHVKKRLIIHFQPNSCTSCCTQSL